MAEIEALKSRLLTVEKNLLSSESLNTRQEHQIGKLKEKVDEKQRMIQKQSAEVQYAEE